jgi:hypothetical protein
VLISHSRVSSVVGRACFSLLLLAGAVNCARGQQPAAPSPSFSRGEELVYEAEFKRGLLRGVDVAEFHFSATTEHTASKDMPGGDPVVLRLVGDVASKGFFTKLAGFHVHQHVESAVDPDPFTVLRTSKLDEQGKRVRTSDAVFDHHARKVTWTETDPNQAQAPRTTVVDFSEPIQDVLTVIYFLRTQRLEVGKSFEVPVSDSGRVFRFSVAVVERKQINSVLGRVNAVRVEPALFGQGGMVRGPGTLSIWITEDSRHLPVKAQVKVNLGTFDIKLRRVTYQKTNRTR